MGEVGGVTKGLGRALAVEEARLRHTEFKLFIRLVHIEQILVFGSKVADLVPIKAAVPVPPKGEHFAIRIDVGVFIVDSDLSFLHLIFRGRSTQIDWLGSFHISDAHCMKLNSSI